MDDKNVDFEIQTTLNFKGIFTQNANSTRIDLKFSERSHCKQTHNPITIAVQNGHHVSLVTATSTTVADKRLICVSQLFDKRGATYGKVSPISCSQMKPRNILPSS